MKFQLSLVLILLAFVSVHAQEGTSAAETVDKIKLQLLDLQAKEEELKARAAQLEEALRPENIERSLAGVGSTRPEELREARRKQLTIERDGVLAQLKILETSRTRLETALAQAEGRAYQESARQIPTQALVAESRTSARWLVIGAVGLFALALIAGLVIYQRAIKLR
ncbi:MAG TPA: hypothetical protein VJT15_14445 [Pyrinomonadaceae bacterium]|nr:hypothetical protein [Pyrinomonadaceae bacterium]